MTKTITVSEADLPSLLQDLDYSKNIVALVPISPNRFAFHRKFVVKWFTGDGRFPITYASADNAEEIRSMDIDTLIIWKCVEIKEEEGGPIEIAIQRMRVSETPKLIYVTETQDWMPKEAGEPEVIAEPVQLTSADRIEALKKAYEALGYEVKITEKPRSAVCVLKNKKLGTKGTYTYKKVIDLLEFHEACLNKPAKQSPRKREGNTRASQTRLLAKR